MAASMNKVFIMGNLTRDPELRYVPSGAAVANFTVAVNRAYKDKAGEKKEDTSFIRVIVWGKMAEICGEYLSKGRPVLVEGRLQSRAWEAQDGSKRSTIEVIAVNVQFLGSRGDRTGEETFTRKENIESVDLNKDVPEDSNSFGAGSIDEIPF